MDAVSIYFLIRDGDRKREKRKKFNKDIGFHFNFFSIFWSHKYKYIEISFYCIALHFFSLSFSSFNLIVVFVCRLSCRSEKQQQSIAYIIKGKKSIFNFLFQPFSCFVSFRARNLNHLFHFGFFVNYFFIGIGSLKFVLYGYFNTTMVRFNSTHTQ